MGHALHPSMTSVALGSFVSASVLDLIGGRSAKPAARRLVVVGLLASVPTVASGLSEFGLLGDVRQRRVAAAHSLANGAALCCYAKSYLRRRPRWADISVAI